MFDKRTGEMAYYRQVGEVPQKRHTQFRKDDGSLVTEADRWRWRPAC